LGVAAGYGVGVLVQRGRHSAVVESAGDDHQRDAGVEHLGGHEVAQVVEPERSQPGVAAVPQEGFGDPVRFPCGGAAIVAEHEGIGPGVAATVGGEVHQDVDRAPVEVDDVAAFGLRRREHRSVGSFDPAGAE
jgi:transposase